MTKLSQLEIEYMDVKTNQQRSADTNSCNAGTSTDHYRSPLAEFSLKNKTINVGMLIYGMLYMKYIVLSKRI